MAAKTQLELQRLPCRYRATLVDGKLTSPRVTRALALLSHVPGNLTGDREIGRLGTEFGVFESTSIARLTAQSSRESRRLETTESRSPDLPDLP